MRMTLQAESAECGLACLAMTASAHGLHTDLADLRRLGAWDIHAHVGTPGPTPEKRMETLVKFADRVGVERLCINMSPPWQHEPTPEQFRKSNDDVLAILKEWSSPSTPKRKVSKRCGKPRVASFAKLPCRWPPLRR